MVSHKKLYLATVVLVVAAVSCQPPPPVPQHVISDSGVDDSPPDRQGGTALALGALLLPAFTSVISTLTSNVGTSLSNAFAATMAGARLELIPIEEMMKNFPPPPPLPLQRRSRLPTTAKPNDHNR